MTWSPSRSKVRERPMEPGRIAVHCDSGFALALRHVECPPGERGVDVRREDMDVMEVQAEHLQRSAVWGLM